MESDCAGGTASQKIGNKRDLLVILLNGKANDDIKVKATQADNSNCSFQLYLLSKAATSTFHTTRRVVSLGRGARCDEAVSMERTSLKPDGKDELEDLKQSQNHFSIEAYSESPSTTTADRPM